MGRKLGSKNLKTRARPDGKKVCTKCNKLKDLKDFHKHKQCIAGYNTVCKVCREPMSKENYENTTKEYRLYTAAKGRSRRKGRDFTIKLSDIVIPTHCPVFNILFTSEGEYSPSLDRIDSTKGYTPDNIRVISKRANVLKNNATLQELEQILQDAKKLYCEI